MISQYVEQMKEAINNSKNSNIILAWAEIWKMLMNLWAKKIWNQYYDITNIK